MSVIVELFRINQFNKCLIPEDFFRFLSCGIQCYFRLHPTKKPEARRVCINLRWASICRKEMWLMRVDAFSRIIQKYIGTESKIRQPLNVLDVAMESLSEKGYVCRRKVPRVRPLPQIAGSESCSGISRRSSSSILQSIFVISSMFSGATALQSATKQSLGLFGPRSLPRKTTTMRRMVLTTPESIIEQASTQNLLDDLIDESVRTRYVVHRLVR
jgi:hypothetical protein